MTPFPKPTPAEIAAAQDRTIPDVMAGDLRVVFSGINPSLYSAAVGHHFARPGNRFWPALHAGGFTPRRLFPYEDALLAGMGFGLTNLVARATTQAAELSAEELEQGGAILRRKAERYRPRVVAFLGISAYRTAFGRPKAVLGLQPETLGPSRIWVLPNPSGLNAHFQPPQLAKLFAELRAAAL
jgi:TDG/mug DNA glycosylase family protein